MKKVALLTAVLMVLSLATLSAQMMDEGSGLTFEIDGKASVTFGIDLTNDLGTGFDVNTASSSVSVTLVAESSAETAGEMGTYGKISLDDFELGVENTLAGGGAVTGSAPGVSAEIVSGALTIGIYSRPSVSVNKVSAISSEVATAYDDARSGSGAIGGGVTIGFAQDPLDLSIEVISAATPDANDASSYAFELNAGLAAGPAELDVAVAMGIGENWTSNDMGIGLATEFDLGTLTPSVAFDMEIPETGESTWEVGVGLAVGVGGAAYVNVDGEYASSETVDARVAFGDSGGDDPAAIPGMDAMELFVAFQINDLTNATGADPSAMNWDLDASGSYDMGDIAPYFGFSLDNDSVIGVTAGVELTMIANTTLDLSYTTDDIENDTGDIDFTVTIAY